MDGIYNLNIISSSQLEETWPAVKDMLLYKNETQIHLQLFITA